MEKRQKIGLALMLLALLISAVYWLLPRDEKASATPEGEAVVPVQSSLGVSVSGTKPAPLAVKPIPSVTGGETVATSPTADTDRLRPLAKTFAERYLSYSTEAKLENLEVAKLMMTPAFAKRTEATIATERVKPVAAEFFGVTSRAVSVELAAYDEREQTAIMLVDLARQERTGASGTLLEPYQQRLTVMFTKVDGEWKVDDAILERYKR